MERRLEQWNDQEPNNQNDRQDRDEHDNNRPLTNAHQERGDQEESNAISRRDQQDTSHPFELEVGVLRMAQEMQMMKEKMDMMMSTSIHQLGRTSLTDRLTFLRAGDFLPPFG